MSAVRSLQSDSCMSPVLVKHLMTSPVVTFFAEQHLPLAEDVMKFKHFRHLPVVDEQRRLVGLVSHRDLLAAQISTRSGLTRKERRAVQEEVCVGEIMTRDVWTVRPDVNASIAGATLLDHKYGCLPVIDEDGVLIGIVTEHDFLRFATKVLEATDEGHYGAKFAFDLDGR
jgi:CBS domain-containing membrane protein